MITPLDIENKKFAKQMMNGYSVDEVDGPTAWLHPQERARDAKIT